MFWSYFMKAIVTSSGLVGGGAQTLDGHLSHSSLVVVSNTRLWFIEVFSKQILLYVCLSIYDIDK